MSHKQLDNCIKSMTGQRAAHAQGLLLVVVIVFVRKVRLCDGVARRAIRPGRHACAPSSRDEERDDSCDSRLDPVAPRFRDLKFYTRFLQTLTAVLLVLYYYHLFVLHLLYSLSQALSPRISKPCRVSPVEHTECPLIEQQSDPLNIRKGRPRGTDQTPH